MDIRQLPYFLTITDLGSITRASEHLGVEQPSLSLHIKNMEESLGTQLFIRGETGGPPETGLADLRHVPLVLPSGSHGLRVQVNRAFGSLGFAPNVAKSTPTPLSNDWSLPVSVPPSCRPMPSLRTCNKAV